MTHLLEISDLKVRFHTELGTVNAVNGISYAVGRGEIVGVVGESGSGKSAHALSIMRLIPPDAGSIEDGTIMLRGRDLLGLSAAEMGAVRGREIGMIFQDPISSLNPVYTVGFQLREMFTRHLDLSGAEAQARSADLLTLVGIPDARQRLESYPHELSGGMRQRVMIAMAIACTPSLLIADEPTTALDVTIQAQIVELVKRLQRELDLSVIWISHDLGVIASLARTVVVMYAGYVVELGPVHDIYRRPCHPYTQALFRSLPRMDRNDAALVPIPGHPPDLVRLPAGCPFAARCAFADRRCLDEMPPVDRSPGAGREVRCWNWRQVAEQGR